MGFVPLTLLQCNERPKFTLFMESARIQAN